LHEELGAPLDLGMVSILFGVLLFHLLSFFFPLHEHGYHEEHNDHNHKNHLHKGLGVYGAGLMITHSFIDGFGIGAGFLVSPALGIAIAIAVIMHNFSDGINTVSLILKSAGSRHSALRWLLLDALAPVLGVASTLFFTVPENTLGIALALFAGFFLYIGASDLLPESHHRHPQVLTTVMTLLGLVVLYSAIQLAGI
jgi:ZIP family zinc transporter